MNTLYQEASERLRVQGGRMTNQRRLIFQTLDTINVHPTAEELFELVSERDPSLNLSTVYRTLRWLEAEGLISARRFDGERRQERFDPGLPIEHYHFLCSSCEKVIEFDHHLIEEVRSQFETTTGVIVHNVSVVLYGLCDVCQHLQQPS